MRGAFTPCTTGAHGQSDAIEGVTHSLCSDEFTNNRPLYDWFIEKLGIFPSRQIEYARGNITYTVLSKRYILQLIEQNLVSGWGRSSALPPCAACAAWGIHRLPYAASGPRPGLPNAATTSTSPSSNTASAISSIRPRPRRMAVLNPLKVVIENYPEDQSEMLTAHQQSGRRQRRHPLHPLFAAPLH